MPEVSERQWASRQICVLWHVVCIKLPPDSTSSHVCFSSITVTSKGPGTESRLSKAPCGSRSQRTAGGWCFSKKLSSPSTQTGGHALHMGP